MTLLVETQKDEIKALKKKNLRVVIAGGDTQIWLSPVENDSVDIHIDVALLPPLNRLGKGGGMRRDDQFGIPEAFAVPSPELSLRSRRQ